MLRLAIVCRETGWREISKHSAPLAILSVPAIALCYTHFFLRSAQLGGGQTQNGLIPQPVYGPLFPLYVAFLCSTILIAIVLYLKSMAQSRGMQKVELQFVTAGGVAMAVLTIITILLQPLLEQKAIVRIAPLRFVIFSLIIAYGVATRKIMDVGFFVRRVTSYAVLTAYLLALYGLVWWLVSTASQPIFPSEAGTFGHLAAALVVAFAMAPARGVSQSLANRLFVGTRGLDFQSTMNQAMGILKSVTTLQDLLDRFAKTIGEAVGTDRVVILLPEKEAYVQQYPPPPAEAWGETPVPLPLPPIPLPSIPTRPTPPPPLPLAARRQTAVITVPPKPAATALSEYFPAGILAVKLPSAAV